ncbi:hypothetical protein [Agromyces archimandritae]|uniref:Uncharacterized protein n=1 Tax=Agromyces archimandritae TaxID=2781962 RepID=A0A975FLP9_9MICO|nr:hypothetical protein [Agromyces archimandritae]QTX04788.1 hypothetical protein G127AT_00475 [Agromyces archimandritae]
MARQSAGRAADHNAFVRFFDRIDRALEPVFGPPPITEGEGRSGPIDAAPCPVCGRPMFEHSVQRTSSDSVLVCPVPDRLAERSEVGPLNELGMPASGRRLERYEAARAR